MIPRLHLLPSKFQRQIPFQPSPQGRNWGTGQPGMTWKGRSELLGGAGAADSSWMELQIWQDLLGHLLFCPVWSEVSQQRGREESNR